MKKILFGISLMLCGTIGFAGTAIACAALSVKGSFDSIISCIRFSGMAFVVIFSIMFVVGLALCIYTLVKEDELFKSHFIKKD